MTGAAIQGEMLGNRLRKNRRRLRKWVKRDAVTCYRLYDRDIPEIPLAIDWYEGRLHIAEYARRGSPQGGEHGPWIESLVAAAASALEVPEADTWLKRRERQRGASQYERFGRSEARFVVGEGGHAFLVNLSDYLDTGLFLDHRTTRRLVAEEAAGRRFLNLFAYTGAFTVYAARGGAATTTTVDMSNTYVEWARENLALNASIGPEHTVVRADVRRFLADCPPDAYDLVVVDPPTFSNSKRMGDVVFDVQRDHVVMLERIARITAPGGVIWFSSNARKLRYEGPGEEVTSKTLPEDFRNRRVHRVWRIER